MCVFIWKKACYGKKKKKLTKQFKLNKKLNKLLKWIIHYYFIVATKIYIQVAQLKLNRPLHPIKKSRWLLKWYVIINMCNAIIKLKNHQMHRYILRQTN